MKNKLRILSMALLGLYSLVILHNMIPHFHAYELSDIAEEMSGVNNGLHEAQHHHMHNTQSSNHAITHEHIAHENHFDEGLFDFFICLLSVSDHANTGIDNCYYIPVNLSKSLTTWIAQAQLTNIVIGAFAEWSDEEVIITFDSEVVSNYLSPHLSSSPLRGPPVFVA